MFIAVAETLSPILESLKDLETAVLARFAAQPWAPDSPLRRGRLVAPGCRDPKETTVFVHEVNRILNERDDKE